MRMGTDTTTFFLSVPIGDIRGHYRISRDAKCVAGRPGKNKVGNCFDPLRAVVSADLRRVQKHPASGGATGRIPRRFTGVANLRPPDAAKRGKSTCGDSDDRDDAAPARRKSPPPNLEPNTKCVETHQARFLGSCKERQGPEAGGQRLGKDEGATTRVART